MYIYTYIYVYICIYVYMCVCVCVFDGHCRKVLREFGLQVKTGYIYIERDIEIDIDR